MEHQILEGPATHEMPLVHSAFVPCHNIWMRNSYFLTGEFELDVQNLPSGCTSGSPAASSGFEMAGFLTPADGRIVGDGDKVVFHAPEGQKLLVVSGGSEQEQWALYNSLVEGPRPEPVERQTFWGLPEYVTWVEQKFLARSEGAKRLGAAGDYLDEAMVKDYVRRVVDLGLPPGKLTIDAGWDHPRGVNHGDGYWRVNTEKFPDMPGMVDWISEQGFTPGLWFGLPRVFEDMALVAERADLVTSSVEIGADGNIPGMEKGALYHRPGEALTEFYVEVFRPYVEMGFRKFKLDFFGGLRWQMAGCIECAHKAIRSLDPTIEIESHHPNTFFSRWCDALRIHDVQVNFGVDWQGLTLAHLRVAELCADGCVINIDHAGGNEEYVGEHDYIRNIRLFDVYDGMDRYPCVSLLPDRFSDKAKDVLRAYVDKHWVIR